MDQLTIRGFDAELAERIRRLAEEEGISLNKAVLRLLRQGAGLHARAGDPHVVGDALDAFIGTWSEEDARAFERAVSGVFDEVDEELWR